MQNMYTLAGCLFNVTWQMYSLGGFMKLAPAVEYPGKGGN